MLGFNGEAAVSVFNKTLKPRRMKVDYTNPKDDQTYVVDLSKLQIIPFPNESVKQMTEMLEPEQIGNVMTALTECIYGDKKPIMNTKAENGMLERLVSEITRLGFSHFKQTKNLKNQNGALTVKDSNIDTSTGEVFEPIDEPMTSELTVNPILEEEQPYTNTTLSEFIESRPEGMMQCPQWSGFVAMYPDAEKIQKLSGITELSAVTLYSKLRKDKFYLW